MKVTKTFRASVLHLTKVKKDLLDTDYENYQWWMIFGKDNGLLSCFKAHKRFKQKTIHYRDYPLPLWSTLIKAWFRHRDTKLTKYWIKIPNSQRKGRGLWLPLTFSQELPGTFTLKDSYLVRKNERYYIHFVLEIDTPPPYVPRNILGIDLGIKNPVTLVSLADKTTKFLGKDLKRIRGKYYYLRKKLGQQKKWHQIRKMKHKEKNKITTLLHTLSKSIVLHASTTQSGLVLGRLGYLRKNKGRKFNRKLSTFPYYTLSRYIRYKAHEKGVPVMVVNEAHTSQTCSVCGSAGKRVKNWFVCPCGHADNADRNAAINIGKRGLSSMFRSGVLACAQKSVPPERTSVDPLPLGQICNLH